MQEDAFSREIRSVVMLPVTHALWLSCPCTFEHPSTHEPKQGRCFIFDRDVVCASSESLSDVVRLSLLAINRCTLFLPSKEKEKRIRHVVVKFGTHAAQNKFSVVVNDFFGAQIQNVVRFLTQMYRRDNDPYNRTSVYSALVNSLGNGSFSGRAPTIALTEKEFQDFFPQIESLEVGKEDSNAAQDEKRETPHVKSPHAIGRGYLRSCIMFRAGDDLGILASVTEFWNFIRSNKCTDNEDEEWIVVFVPEAAVVITTHRIIFLPKKKVASSMVAILSSEIAVMYPSEEQGLAILLEEQTAPHIVFNDILPFAQKMILRCWLASLSIETKAMLELSTFSGSSKHITHSSMVHPATVDALERLHSQFKAIDVSGDGNIDEDELSSALSCLFTSDSFVSLLFRAFDLNDDSNISFKEFATGLSDILVADHLHRLRFSFRMFDANGDGDVSQEELFNVLQSLSSTGEIAASTRDIQEISEQLFSLMDTDNSGTIDVEEYLHAVSTDQKTYQMLADCGFSLDRPVEPVQLNNDVKSLLSVGDKDWTLSATLMQALTFVCSNDRDTTESSAVLEGDLSDAMSTFALNSGTGLFEAIGRKAPVCLEEHQEKQLAAGGATVQLTIYSPMMFRKIRSVVGLTTSHMMESLGVKNVAANLLLGTDKVLKRVHSTHDALADFCFATFDYLMLIRALTDVEVTNLVEILPHYSDYISAHVDTVLPKYIGLFSLDCPTQNKHIYFVLQLNTLRHEVPLQNAFYFQGVKYTPRAEGDPALCLALTERDLQEPLELAEDWSVALHHQLSMDLMFLASHGLTEYSLYVGLEEADAERNARARSKKFTATSQTVLEGAPIAVNRSDEGLSCWGRIMKLLCVASTVKEAEQLPTVCRRPGFGEERVTVELAALAPGATKQASSTTRGMQPSFGLPAWWEASLRASKFYLRRGGVPSDNENHVVFFGVLSILATKAVPVPKALVFRRRLLDYLRLAVLSTELGIEQKVMFPLVPSSTVDQQKLNFEVFRESGGRCLCVLDKFEKKLFLKNPNASKALLSFDIMGLSLVRMSNLCAPKDILLLRELLRLDQTPPEFAKLRLLKMGSFQDAEILRATVCETQEGSVKEAGKPGTICVATFNVGDTMPGHLWTWVRDTWEPDQADIVVVAAQNCNYMCDEATNENHFFNAVNDVLVGFTCIQKVTARGARLFLFANNISADHISNIEAAVAIKDSSVAACTSAALAFKYYETRFCVVTCDLSELSITGEGSLFEAIEEGVNSVFQALNTRMGTGGCGLLTEYHHCFWAGSIPPPTSVNFSSVLHRGRCFTCFKDEMPQNDPKFSRGRVLRKSLDHPLDRMRCLKSITDESERRGREHVPMLARFSFNARTPQFPLTLVSAKIVISQLSAEDLWCPSVLGKANPRATFYCGVASCPCSTSIVPHTVDPKWREEWELPLLAVSVSQVASEYLYIELLDMPSREPLGHSAVSLHQLGEAISAAHESSQNEPVEDEQTGVQERSAWPAVSVPVTALIYRNCALSGHLSMQLRLEPQ